MLTDATGEVVYDERAQRVGTELSEAERTSALPIEVNGVTGGYLLLGAQGGGALAANEQDFLDQLQRTLLIAALIAGGVLERVECEGFGPEKGGLVEATSDPRWSPELQRSWPYFIMGASQTWLRLIDEYARQAPPAGEAQPVDETLALYEQVDRAVTRTWQQEGHHAFLHHLNALFGYAPIDVGEASPRRF